MGSRLELQNELEKLLGSKNVYFQPPASISMKYPAIRYSLSDVENWHADDIPFKQAKAYEVILIDRDQDNEYVDKLSQFRYCSFDRYYPADNLNHYVFTLYY